MMSGFSLDDARLLQGLIDPLVNAAQTLAGALFSSLGSSTSALMSGGASIINTILDAVSFYPPGPFCSP